MFKHAKKIFAAIVSACMILAMVVTNAPLSAMAIEPIGEPLADLKFRVSDLEHGTVSYKVGSTLSGTLDAADADEFGAIWIENIIVTSQTVEITAEPDEGYVVRDIRAFEGEGSSSPAYNGNFADGKYTFPMCNPMVYDVQVTFVEEGEDTPPGPGPGPGPGPDLGPTPANYNAAGYISFDTHGDVSGQISYAFVTDLDDVESESYTHVNTAGNYYEPINMSTMGEKYLVLAFQANNSKNIDMDRGLIVRNSETNKRIYSINGNYNDDPNYNEETEGKQLDHKGLNDCAAGRPLQYYVPLDLTEYAEEKINVELGWNEVVYVGFSVDEASQYMLSNEKAEISIATGKGFKTKVTNTGIADIPILEDYDMGGHEERYLIDIKINPQYYIPELSINGNKFETFDAGSGTDEYVSLAVAIPSHEFKDMLVEADGFFEIHLTVDKGVGVTDSQGNEIGVQAAFRLIDDGDIPENTTMEYLDTDASLEADQKTVSDAEKATGIVDAYEISLEVGDTAETEFPVPINVLIPGEYQDEVEYKVIREHEGEATTEIECHVEAGNIIFSTDKFSKFSVKTALLPHVHKGTKVKQVDATCTKYGTKAYYKCECGKFYSDSACTKEITNLTTWKSGDGRIAKKAHTLATTTTKATTTTNGKKVTKCSVCGTVTKTVTIYAAKTIKLSATEYTYNGKVKTPTVSIKDSKGNTVAATNYTVTYASGRKNVGKYVVKVTFKGDYTGSQKLSFKINPAKTSIKSVTAGSKAFTVKWTKKATQVTGYQIQYSASKDFASGNKTVTIKSNATVSKTIKSLKAKKKYYVRVRTYKTVSGVNYYSAWSDKKAVTTK